MDLRHRPRYHFLPLSNWMNDPNGLVQWRGVYHLFYQHNPNGPNSSNMHWGHACSRDLVHWRHLPVALAPTPDGYDKDGVWSGCALINDGVPTAIYTGVHPQVQCLATSDDAMIEWTKYPGNPVIPGPPEGLDATGFRDPCVWRENGSWYLVLGSGARGVGGLILLYRSADLRSWEYLGPLLEGNIEETGYNWECPNYLSLGTGRLLIFSPQPTMQAHYYTGRQEGLRFLPGTHGLLDYGGLYYAPQAFVDEAGRRICFGWLLEGRPREVAAEAGWLGVQSLPRELSLGEDGVLLQRPVPEIESLREECLSEAPHTWRGSELMAISGNMVELDLTIDPGSAEACEIQVLASPDGAERTVIRYAPAAQSLTLDTRGASLDPTAGGREESAPLELPSGELRLWVFVDHSVIEVFANDRVCLTGRAYPTREDALGVALTASGGDARLLHFDGWRLSSIWNSLD